MVDEMLCPLDQQILFIPTLDQFLGRGSHKEASLVPTCYERHLYINSS